MCPTDSRKTKCILKGSHHQMLSHVKKIRTSLKNLRRKVAKEQNSPFIFNVAAAAAFLSQVQGL